MPRFFTEPVLGERATLFGEDARHIARSLRMRVGEQLTLCDGQGQDYLCVLEEVQPERVSARVLETTKSTGEPSVHLTLYQAYPKGDKLETIVQKSVELGVARIVPILTAHCVARPEKADFAKKQERYQRIATEAAKQCGRGRIPEVAPLLDFSEALSEVAGVPAALFYEEATTSMRAALSGQLTSRFAFFVGSEGGFSPAEAAEAKEAGLLHLSLGARILRCETAAPAALAAMLYELGEM